MLRHRLLIAALAIPVGWVALFALTYLLERPLLIWTAPLAGSHWVATVKLALDCLVLAATGWIVGRLDRSAPLPGALAFAATLAFCNLNPLLNLNVLPLIRLAAAAIRDPRFLGVWVTTAVPYFFQFGSLIAGALLSRPSPLPLSILGRNAP
ncbi:MAG TPA: hypothetical protein VGZ29_11295 [Terriglobia bacterium]|nr:hypothetical protein [Terriglobia bacterium]